MVFSDQESGLTGRHPSRLRSSPGGSSPATKAKSRTSGKCCASRQAATGSQETTLHRTGGRPMHGAGIAP